MAILQGSASFGGIVGIDAFDFLLTRGVRPSRGMVATPVLGQIAPPIADLVVNYGGPDGVTLTFGGCCATESYVDNNGSSPRLVIWLEDRRWKWEFTEIVGRYNVRESQTENAIKYEKTPQQLVALLATAMGETIDATALPNDARPYVDWRNSRCDTELADILHALGCDIAPDLNTGNWVVVKIGAGEAFPSEPTVEHASAGVTIPKTPERIRAIGGNVRYQCAFGTEAVGLDTDGKWKKINDLSYKPGSGWLDEDPELFDGVTGTYTDLATGETLQERDLALATVYRNYRIRSVVNGGGANNLNPPGFADAVAAGAPDIEEIGQLLPLLSVINETYLDVDGQRRPKRPYLFGTWFADFVGTKEGGTDVVDADGNIANASMYDGFSLDLETGIISFPRPLVSFSSVTGKFHAADPLLFAVCEADWVGLNTKVYYGLTRDKDGVGSPTRVLSIHRPEVILKYRRRWDVGGAELITASNKTSVDAELGYYLDALEDSFIDQTAATATYRDLLLVNLDGAIEQVQWSIGADGTTTRVARNTQIYPYLSDYKQMIRQAKIDKAIAAATLAGEIKPQDLFGAG
jgi:hypothetical protein